MKYMAFCVLGWVLGGGMVVEGLDIVQHALKDAVSILVGACSDTVCWGTVLQARRSQVWFQMVSL